MNRVRLIPKRQYMVLFFIIIFSMFPIAIENAKAHSLVGSTKKSSMLLKVVTISVKGRGAGSQSNNNLIDGNLNTRWRATQLPLQFVLDLGISQKVNKVQMVFSRHRNSKQHRYSIAVSQDGTSWMQVVNGGRLSGARWTRAGFSPINARYIRISVNSATHTDSLIIRDFMIYGPVARREGNGSTSGTPGQLVTLKWSPSPGHINGYLVFYGPSANLASAQISDISINSPGFNPQAPSIQYDSWFDLNALPGDNICFRVRAYGAAGLSAWSSAVCSGV